MYCWTALANVDHLGAWNSVVSWKWLHANILTAIYTASPVERAIMYHSGIMGHTLCLLQNISCDQHMFSVQNLEVTLVYTEGTDKLTKHNIDYRSALGYYKCCTIGS